MTQTTTSPTQSASALQQPPERPFITEFFMVENAGIHCMAYCDAEQKWRNALTHHELFGEIRILE